MQLCKQFFFIIPGKIIKSVKERIKTGEEGGRTDTENEIDEMEGTAV